jgi:imidazolonepropionase-like amidohydrolase
MQALIRRLLFTILAALSAWVSPRDAAAQVGSAPSVALESVTTIDGTGEGPRSDVTVLIQGDRIEAVFPTGSVELPESVERIDLSGHFLIPGLINTHIHLLMLGLTPSRGWDRDQALAALERMLQAGVTTLREAAGDTRLSAELARAGLANEAEIPSIHFAVRMAGPSFYDAGGGNFTSLGFEPGTAPWAQAISPDTDLSRAVARAVGTGATGIKLYADLTPDVVQGLTQEAHRQGLQSWAHATVFPTDPTEAVRAGVDVLSHICFIFWGLQPEVPERFANRPPFDPEQVDVNGPAYVELFREMAERGTIFDVTARNAAQNELATAAGCTPDLMISALEAAHEAGVLFSTGTDYFMSEGEPDPTLYAEIAYLVESGVLSPLEAISAATLHGARAVGMEDQIGSIEPGKVADLVILSSDPLVEIDALQSITAVVKNGIVHWREDYEARLDGGR